MPDSESCKPAVNESVEKLRTKIRNMEYRCPIKSSRALDALDREILAQPNPKGVGKGGVSTDVKDEANKNKAKKDEANKNEVNKNEAHKDEANKAKKDEANKNEVNQNEAHKDEANKDSGDKDNGGAPKNSAIMSRSTQTSAKADASNINATNAHVHIKYPKAAWVARCALKLHDLLFAHLIHLVAIESLNDIRRSLVEIYLLLLFTTIQFMDITPAMGQERDAEVEFPYTEFPLITSNKMPSKPEYVPHPDTMFVVGVDRIAKKVFLFEPPFSAGRSLLTKIMPQYDGSSYTGFLHDDKYLGENRILLKHQRKDKKVGHVSLIWLWDVEAGPILDSVDVPRPRNRLLFSPLSEPLPLSQLPADLQRSILEFLWRQ